MVLLPLERPGDRGPRVGRLNMNKTSNGRLVCKHFCLCHGQQWEQLPWSHALLFLLFCLPHWETEWVAQITHSAFRTSNTSRGYQRKRIRWIVVVIFLSRPKDTWPFHCFPYTVVNVNNSRPLKLSSGNVNAMFSSTWSCSVFMQTTTQLWVYTSCLEKGFICPLRHDQNWTFSQKQKTLIPNISVAGLYNRGKLRKGCRRADTGDASSRSYLKEDEGLARK